VKELGRIQHTNTAREKETKTGRQVVKLKIRV
jgi:hypothetical protein